VLGDGKVAEEVSRIGNIFYHKESGVAFLQMSLLGKSRKGTHDELLALGGKYAEMWNMQLNSTGGNRSTGSLTGLMTG